MPPRRLNFGALVDPDSEEPLDEVLVALMPAPRSYTGEDVVEISCHGNPVLLGEIVRLLVMQGARLAAPGEFTRRAYVNGRMNLIEAEAVALLIQAQSEQAIRMATRHIAGALHVRIRSLREAVLDTMAAMEVALDFPDDEVEGSPKSVESSLGAIARSLGDLADRCRRGRIVHHGLSVMIAGAPNVGKSSLLNALLGRDRAIVSPLPGTTRDLIDGSIVMNGILVRLTDGAGLGIPLDTIDAEAMRRTKEAIAASDLVIVVTDGSRPMSQADRQVLDMTGETERLVIANKCDLSRADQQIRFDCECSAMTGQGVGDILAHLENWAKRKASEGAEESVVTSFRVMENICAAQIAVERAAAGIRRGIPLELVLVDLREARRGLEETAGIEADDALLDRIFATFCVGK